MNEKYTKLGPASLFRHDHPPVKNANVELEERLTIGQRLADFVTGMLGSWPFIITQTVLLIAWVLVNVYLVSMALFRPGYFRACENGTKVRFNLLMIFRVLGYNENVERLS